MKALLWSVIAFLAVLAAVWIFSPGEVRAQTPTVVLNWTAPGDDGDVGRASAYEARYSTTPVGTDTTSWWNGATAITGLPVPSPSGSADSVVVSPPGGFPAGQYFFIIRARDEVMNWSGWSNVAVKTITDIIAPRRILDLRIR